jgi:hypothetical protein
MERYSTSEGCTSAGSDVVVEDEESDRLDSAVARCGLDAVEGNELEADGERLGARPD